MLPKKAFDLIPERAGEEGIPEQDMYDMISAYWKEVKSILTEMDYIRLSIPGLGMFVTSYTRIFEALELEHGKVLKAEKRKRGKLGADDPGGTSKDMEKLKLLKDIWMEEFRYRDKLKEDKRIYKETGYKPVKPRHNELKVKAVKRMGKKKGNR